MAGRVVVSLVAPDADANAVHHEQQRQGCEAIEPGVGGHGWDGRWAAGWP